jgi:hypothetical protein
MRSIPKVDTQVLNAQRKSRLVEFGLASLKNLGIGGKRQIGSHQSHSRNHVQKARNRSTNATSKAISVQGVNEFITFQADNSTTALALMYPKVNGGFVL